MEQELTDALVQISFIQSRYDYFVFTKKVEELLVIILLYVDGLLVTGNSEEMINQGKNYNTNSKPRTLEN